jgi:hypothetical protein
MPNVCEEHLRKCPRFLMENRDGDHILLQAACAADPSTTLARQCLGRSILQWVKLFIDHFKKLPKLSNIEQLSISRW